MGGDVLISVSQIAQAISIQPDKNNQAKAYQVRQFLRLIERYNLKLQGD